MPPAVPRTVPTLTDVVQPAPAAAAPASASTAPDVARIVDAVLADLQQRIDATLAQQVREAMAPAMAQALERLLHETRLALARSLHDQVEQAVARALSADRMPSIQAGCGASERGTGLAG